MILHYLKIAWRNLIRHRLYSAINIGGLSIAISEKKGDSLQRIPFMRVSHSSDYIPFSIFLHFSASCR